MSDRMEPTNILAVAASKPMTGIGISASAYILHIIGAISPYLTFLALLVGLVATIYSFVAKRQHVKNEKLEKEHLQLVIERDKLKLAEYRAKELICNVEHCTKRQNEDE